ncbi:MAG: hypothetical protein GY722_29880 [bacterium]|nr:hypothetical protein [bacterium]
MSSPRKHRQRPRRTRRFLLGVTASFPFLLAAGGLSAAPIAVNVDSGSLYEIDLATGEYSLATQFDQPVRCGPLTGVDDTLFCTIATEFEGTWVRGLERSSAIVVWEVNFPDLDFPDAIAYSDSLLYVVAEREPRRFYLLTLDPGTGEELARIWLSDLGYVDGGLQVPYALAPRGPELWLLRTGIRVGLRAHRLDPLTGKTLESFDVPGAGVVDDADFGPDGRLWVSRWEWDVINVGWCTHYWMVPFLSAPAELQFSHCWDPPDPPLPNLAHFTFANPEVATPAVEIPTLGAVSVWVFGAILSLAGGFALRGRRRPI